MMRNFGKRLYRVFPAQKKPNRSRLQILVPPGSCIDTQGGTRIRCNLWARSGPQRRCIIQNHSRVMHLPSPPNLAVHQDKYAGQPVRSVILCGRNIQRASKPAACETEKIFAQTKIRSYSLRAIQHKLIGCGVGLCSFSSFPNTNPCPSGGRLLRRPAMKRRSHFPRMQGGF